MSRVSLPGCLRTIHVTHYNIKKAGVKFEIHYFAKYSVNFVVVVVGGGCIGFTDPIKTQVMLRNLLRLAY